MQNNLVDNPFYLGVDRHSWLNLTERSKLFYVRFAHQNRYTSNRIHSHQGTSPSQIALRSRPRLFRGLHSLHVFTYLDVFMVQTVSHSQPSAHVLIYAAEIISAFNVALVLTFHLVLPISFLMPWLLQLHSAGDGLISSKMSQEKLNFHLTLQPNVFWTS